MKIILIGLLLTFLIEADTLAKVEDEKLYITIYNSNLAFINEKRTANVSKGFNNIVYKNVASSIIEESILPIFTNIDNILYSQNYIYNTLNINSLLKHSLNKNINFFSNNNKKELKSGILLAYNPYVIIKDYETDKIFTLNEKKDVVFNKIPKDIIIQPSLIWKLEAKNRGKIDIDLKYLTRNISWKSNYIINLKKNKLNISGLITINNNSGITYKNANITCLAGEIGRKPQKRYMNYRRSISSFSDKKPIVDESFSGYHIYKIPFKETIKNREKKQIVFIDKKNIKYTNWGEVKTFFSSNQGKVKLTFNNVIEFQNSKKNNLGITFPAGDVRLYKNDLSGQAHFIGEDKITNTPKNENIKLRIGKFFDIVGERETIRKNDIRIPYFKNLYNIRNQGEEEIVIRIIENYSQSIKSYHNWSIVNYKKDRMKKKKIDSFTMEIEIKLKPNEKYSFYTEKI